MKDLPVRSHLAFLKVPNGEELIELASSGGIGQGAAGRSHHLTFEVDNLDDTICELNEKQVKITDGPTPTSFSSRVVFIDASDGCESELIERPSGIMHV